MRNKELFRLAAIGALGLTLSLNAAQAQRKMSKHPFAKKMEDNAALLPLDPAVRTGKLPNGFTYYIRHNEEPTNRALMYLVNKVGSILEDEDQRGLAHFMEHMSFNGTKHFPHNELGDYLQRSGVRFGADLNAYTSFDETVYELPIPSDKPALLNGGLQVMRDWAQEALLDPAEIDKERGVVLEEKRLGKGAQERMGRIYYPVLLNNSRYALRIPIGLDTVLDNFKRPTIARFYHDWYRPDLQALIVVGDIDVNAMEKEVKAKFSNLKNPVKERARTKYTVALTGKNNFMALTDKEQPQTTVQVLIKHPALKLKTAADYRRFLIRNLFNQMLAERFQELTQQANPPFVEGGAGISGFMGGLDAFNLSVTTKPGALESGFEAGWREVVRLNQYGFTQTELDREKSGMLSNLEAAVREKDKTKSANYVKEYQSYFLNEEAAPGIEKEYALTKADLPGISLQDVNHLTNEYVTATNRDILIEAPEKDKALLPAEVTVNGWVKQVESEKLEPYKDETSTKNLLSADPQPGKITSEQKNNVLGFTTLILSNGVKVILKPTDFKNDEIKFTSFAPGGTSLASDGDYQSAANAAGLVSAGGAGNYNYTQLSKFLADKQLAVQPYISELYQGVSGQSTVKDLGTALELVNAYFTEPRKDAVMFQSIIERSKAGIASRASDPRSVFQDSSLAVLYNGNYRKTGPTLEKLGQVNLDKAYEIYKERFANAADFTFVFVGSFDVGQVKPMLEKYLGSLPATRTPGQFKDLGIYIAAGKIERNIHKGEEPRATVRLIFSGPYDYSRQNNLNFEALKEVMQIRLLERLREDESGVYSPQVSYNTSKFPTSTYVYSISFACSPANVDKLVASALDEVNKLRTKGPLQVNIDKWKAEYSNQMEINLKSNDFWLASLNAHVQNNLELLPMEAYKQRLEKVSGESVKILASQYLSTKNYIRLVLLPESSDKQPITKQPF